MREHELEIEKSRFTILQEQINPHFLYNSLDTIRICMLMDKKRQPAV
ncbi:MAG: histidine kinase [Blautia marasmi]